MNSMRFTIAAMLAVLLLAGCSSSKSSTPATPDDTPEPITMPTPQETCEAADGRWNADGTCTNADELTMERMAAQRADIKMKIDAATTAVNAVDNDSTEADVTAAETAIAAAKMAIMDAADIPAAEKTANTGTITALETLLSGAKTARMDAMDEDDRIAAEARAADAAKLYAGIGTAPLTATGDGARSAVYSGTDYANITVTMDDAAEGDGTDVTQVLKATEMTVAANHGWDGKQYAASGDDVDGTYEARVYSNVGESTQGKKFGHAEQATVAAVTAAYEYPLVNGMLIVTAAINTGARVGGSGFDHTAGVKQFPLPTSNPLGNTKVAVSGTFHGVSGTYTCTPGTGATCAASKTEKGFALGTIPDGSPFAPSDTAWTFKPGNPEARVTDNPDTAYASYGWWLHKGSDGKWTASAFVDYKGATDFPAAAGVMALQGTARYIGGAAGQYALASSTGGTNDAGHFTARATLEADFGDATDVGTITGTIDQFMGADGESRDWSVELMKSNLDDAGAIAGDPDNSTDTGSQMTKWTIDETAVAASGMWSGDLKDTTATDTDVSGVPKIVTGTFSTEYGTAGRMVGAFGANKQ